MNPAIENLINELKGYGLDDNKINALMALAYEDFMADFKLDLEKLSDQDMAQLEGQFKNMRVNELL
jgi:hypothetical protein